MKKNEYEYKGYRITEGERGWYVFPLRGGQRISLNIFPTSAEAEEWVDENSED